jgi:hypothetical protein
MALGRLTLALCAIAAASPGAASVVPQDAPTENDGPDVLYCMHIEAITGSRLERIVCWTRAEWAQNEVDLDRDWPKEGVSIIRR